METCLSTVVCPEIGLCAHVGTPKQYRTFRLSEHCVSVGVGDEPSGCCPATTRDSCAKSPLALPLLPQSNPNRFHRP